MIGTLSHHEQKRQRLAAQLRAQSGGQVRLGKQTSNLFRDRSTAPTIRLDVGAFDQVLDVDPDAGTVTAEGMTTYADLAEATLARGCMPAVVPQLKSITIGGAVSGIGIESTSFRHGLAHETVSEMDVLTADGSVLSCTPDNEHSDLFFGLPNSYGTLGYVLKLRAATVPVKPFVRLEHLHHDRPGPFFDQIGQFCEQDPDFLDGVVFAGDQLVITVGRFADEAPFVSDYSFEHIYYRSLRDRRSDYLTTGDYLWRWDTDWFWCSKNVGAQNPLLRRLYGRRRLNSVFYTRLMRANARWGLTRRLNRLLGRHTESVIQDVDIPLARAAEFLEFFIREIGIRPVWICPIGGRDRHHRYPLYPIDPATIYVNFGFWDVISSRRKRPPGYHNRKIEEQVEALGGVKSLYSESFYQRDKFWQLYNHRAYDSLKEKYDPKGRFPDLYDKCVLRV